MTKKRKGIIFARVSTKRQEKEGLSIKEIQLPKAYEYAKKNNIEIVKEYAISETGGNYKTRKKFLEMLEYVKQHDAITDIIALKADRLTRNIKDAVVIDDLRKEYHKTIHLVDNNLILDENSGPNAIFMWDMYIVFARQQLEIIREYGLNVKNTKLKNGELPWTAPFGYINDKENKTVKVDRFEAEIVKEVYKRYNTGLYSYKSLAKEIAEEYPINMPKNRIDRILNNKFYIGIMLDNRTGTEYKHYYQTLINEEMYYSVQSIKKRNSKKKTKYASIPFTYRGLITCSYCGCTVTPERKIKKGLVNNFV